jgi:hypothetical protein
MSSEEEDERREYVRAEPGVVASGTVAEVVTRAPPGVAVVETTAASPSVKRESIVTHRTTNTSALVGIVVGVVVLAMGLFLVIRETPLLPYPWSLFAILAVGIGLVGIGASLVSNRTVS